MWRLQSKWQPNKPIEAKNCYGTTSIEHPAVQMISMERGKYYMGALWAQTKGLTFTQPGSQAVTSKVLIHICDHNCTIVITTAQLFWIIFNQDRGSAQHPLSFGIRLLPAPAERHITAC